MRKFVVVAIGLSLTVAGNAATIFSDGFEPGVNPYLEISSGGAIPPSPAPPIWVAALAGVDWIGSYWTAAAGTGSVDLSATNAGSVSTTLNTVAGQSYFINFMMAGNPDGGNQIKQMTVTAGSTSQDFFFDTTGATKTAMGWLPKSMGFQAVGGSTTITFQSRELNAYGPALDEVSVSSVPEPGTYAVALLGLAAIGLIRRRR
jgi:choice-of-anchor C domain-containing protein